jgi:hypothetical protein
MWSTGWCATHANLAVGFLLAVRGAGLDRGLRAGIPSETLTSPQTLIWSMAVGLSCLQALLMRAVAMARIADMIRSSAREDRGAGCDRAEAARDRR